MVKDTQNMNTTEMELKAIAKAIGTSLKKAGSPVAHSTLLHAVSSALDKRDWHKLKAALGSSVLATAEKAVFAKAVEIKYTDSTMFFLRLAYAFGKPVWPISADDATAKAQAMAACGDLNGVLSWKGWNVPATLLLATSKLDAGDFAPDASATSGNLKVTLVAVNTQLLIEVGFTKKDGWYLSSTGAASAFQQLESFVAKELVLQAPAAPNAGKTVIRAEFHTDDRVFEVEFDAEPYFRQASDQALAAILEIGFRGDYATDNVAEFICCKKLSDALQEGFDYLSAVGKSNLRDTIGFECEVNEEDYLCWMDANRPEVLAQLLCDREGVSFVQAEEPEIAGEWNWLSNTRDMVSSTSFTSLEEAQLDAYQVLNLLQEALDGKLL